MLHGNWYAQSIFCDIRAIIFCDMSQKIHQMSQKTMLKRKKSCVEWFIRLPAHINMVQDMYSAYYWYFETQSLSLNFLWHVTENSPKCHKKLLENTKICCDICCIGYPARTNNVYHCYGTYNEHFRASTVFLNFLWHVTENSWQRAVWDET